MPPAQVLLDNQHEHVPPGFEREPQKGFRGLDAFAPSARKERDSRRPGMPGRLHHRLGVPVVDEGHDQLEVHREGFCLTLSEGADRADPRDPGPNRRTSRVRPKWVAEPPIRLERPAAESSMHRERDAGMGTGLGGRASRTHYCAARSSTSSAHWFRLLPASSAASAALR